MGTPRDADGECQHEQNVVVELARVDVVAVPLGSRDPFGAERGPEWRVQIRVEDQRHGDGEADVKLRRRTEPVIQVDLVRPGLHVPEDERDRDAQRDQKLCNAPTIKHNNQPDQAQLPQHVD